MSRATGAKPHSTANADAVVHQRTQRPRRSRRMLIDALVPIDCRAASFRHLPSRRRATIIPITRPPLLTLIDAPFSPGLSRYTHQLRDVKMDNIWANLPETRQS